MASHSDGLLKADVGKLPMEDLDHASANRMVSLQYPKCVMSTSRNQVQVNPMLRCPVSIDNALMRTRSCLSEGIIQRTNFGHEFIESNTQLIFKIKDIWKANYLFARMDIDGAEVDRNSLLKKKFQDSLERCEVIVTEDKPMELKFNKSSEVVMVTFHYGYWNQHGIPQH